MVIHPFFRYWLLTFAALPIAAALGFLVSIVVRNVAIIASATVRATKAWKSLRTRVLKLWYWRELRHVGRSEDGGIYIRDPETGAMRKAVIGAGGKYTVESKVERRSRRKFFRNAKNALRGL